VRLKDVVDTFQLSPISDVTERFIEGMHAPRLALRITTRTRLTTAVTRTSHKQNTNSSLFNRRTGVPESST
jgi:hypothetical protein